MTKTSHKFSVSRAKDAEFEIDGLRDYFAYRNLDIDKATNGEFGANVIKVNKTCAGRGGKHRHAIGFQMVYVLKGTCTFWYQGEGEITSSVGDCIYQPPGILHELVSYSDDCELLEITMPASFSTEETAAVAAE